MDDSSPTPTARARALDQTQVIGSVAPLVGFRPLFEKLPIHFTPAILLCNFHGGKAGLAVRQLKKLFVRFWLS